MLPQILSLLVRTKLTQSLLMNGGRNARNGGTTNRNQHQWLWKRTMERIGYLGLKRVFGIDKFLDEQFSNKSLPFFAADATNAAADSTSDSTTKNSTESGSSSSRNKSNSNTNNDRRKGKMTHGYRDRHHHHSNEKQRQTNNPNHHVSNRKDTHNDQVVVDVDRDDDDTSTIEDSDGRHSTSTHRLHRHQNLPPFTGISYDSIILVNNEERLELARRDLLNQTVLGFDTESKPDLYAHAKRSGPHLLQLSTTEKTYLFSFVMQRPSYTPTSSSSLSSTILKEGDVIGKIPTSSGSSDITGSSYATKLSELFTNIGNSNSNSSGSESNSNSVRNISTQSIPTTSSISSAPTTMTWKQKTKFRKQIQQLLKEILESSSIKKVGFGLTDDRFLLLKNLQINLQNDIDLSLVLRPQKSSNLIGVKTAVKVYLQQELIKSKRITISNWGIPMEALKMNQILYAANDAYASLLVYNAWCNNNSNNNNQIEHSTKSVIEKEEAVATPTTTK